MHEQLFGHLLAVHAPQNLDLIPAEDMNIELGRSENHAWQSSGSPGRLCQRQKLFETLPDAIPASTPDSLAVLAMCTYKQSQISALIEARGSTLRLQIAPLFLR